jgi:hypothetical protein
MTNEEAVAILKKAARARALDTVRSGRFTRRDIRDAFRWVGLDVKADKPTKATRRRAKLRMLYKHFLEGEIMGQFIEMQRMRDA